MKACIAIAVLMLGVASGQAAEPVEPGVAARASSNFTLSTIKMAAQHLPLVRFDAECIAGIDSFALTNEYQVLIEQNFTAAEQDDLTRFFSSSAGQKYIQDALQKTEAQNFVSTRPPVEFANDESEQVAAFLSLAVGKKYPRLISNTSQEWKSTVGPAFAKLLQQCQRQ